MSFDRFTYRNFKGETYSVELRVETDRLKNAMAIKAIRNASGKASMMNGAVKVKATRIDAPKTKLANPTAEF